MTQILTAAELKDIKKEWQGRLPDKVAMVTPYGLAQIDSILKALERVQKAGKLLIQTWEELGDIDEHVEDMRQALRDTGWEVTDGKD